MPSNNSLSYHTVNLPAGTTLFTVVGESWPTPHKGYPNPGKGRFSPIIASDDSLVTTLYAGQTARCALGEIVFRDLCAGGVVHQRRLLEQAMLCTQTPRDLTLVDLRPVAARGAGSQFYDADLGTTIGAWPASEYERSAKLGSTIYCDSSTEWDGICWESRQAPPHDAYLIFTDRVALRPLSDPEPLISPAWLAEAGSLAAELRVLLPTTL